MTVYDPSLPVPHVRIVTRSKGLPSSRGNILFAPPDEWDDYLQREIYRGGDEILLLYVDDIDDWSFRAFRRKRTDSIDARASMPAAWLMNCPLEEIGRVYWSALERFWTDLTATGLIPPPPPWPPWQDVAQDELYEPERVPMAQVTWDSRRKGVRTIRDETGTEFIESREWQAYLREIDPDDTLWVEPVVNDRETIRRKVVRYKNGDRRIDVDIPVSMFDGLSKSEVQELYRQIARDTYVWGVERFGWPEPPPLPRS